MPGVLFSHHSLGSDLADAEQPGPALAHHLASALLRVITGAAGVERSIAAAADDLRTGGEAAMPPDVAACAPS